MMSLRAVHAGSGYRYLLRSVATNDADPGTPAPRVGADNGPGSPDRLSAYYQAKGTPSGRWRGSGLGSLDSEFVAAGAEISEDQMAALYGEGLHPDADARVDDGESLKDVKLGRAFGVYTDGKPVLKALAAAEKDFRTTHDRRPDEAERSELARTVGWAHYADAHGGQEPADSRQVLGWVNRVQDTTRQAVAGFDLTFSPVKSVSTLWALADEDTANTIATAHHKAVAEALSWVEDNALFTRVGVNGIQQLSTTGIVASEFTHFDTRGGDPDLHSHVLVSNKVQIADTPDARKAGKVGQWKTLDSQQMFQHATSAGGVYNTALQHHLTEALGVEFTPVVKTAGKEPVWEIKGVATALNEKFSSRRTLAKPLYEQMVSEYVATHKRQPSRRANYELWQAAILETRDAKKPAESLDTLRAQWREAAQEVISPEQIDGLVARVRNAESTRVLASDDHIRPLAQQSIEVVLGRRATFKRTHLHTSVSQLLHGYRFTDAAHHQRVYNQVMDTALNQMSVCLTPPETLALPDALTAEAGHGIDRKNNSEVYTTAEHLERERVVLDAADTPAPAFVESHKLDAALHRFTESRGLKSQRF